jgi:hypothetical protein
MNYEHRFPPEGNHNSEYEVNDRSIGVLDFDVPLFICSSVPLFLYYDR